MRGDPIMSYRNRKKIAPVQFGLNGSDLVFQADGGVPRSTGGRLVGPPAI
jgi:hypothetical protein